MHSRYVGSFDNKQYRETTTCVELQEFTRAKMPHESQQPCLATFNIEAWQALAPQQPMVSTCDDKLAWDSLIPFSPKQFYGNFTAKAPSAIHDMALLAQMESTTPNLS